MRTRERDMTGVSFGTGWVPSAGGSFMLAPLGLACIAVTPGTGVYELRFDSRFLPIGLAAAGSGAPARIFKPQWFGPGLATVHQVNYNDLGIAGSFTVQLWLRDLRS